MKRSVAVLAGVAMTVLALATPAAATWSSGADPGAAGRAGALTMPAGATPTATVDGNDVTVAWAATTNPPATGYTVRAFDALSGVERPITAACSGVVAALTCTEHGVPDGTWRYSVIPRLNSWVGFEGDRSAAATVDVAAPEPIALALTNVTGGTPGVIDPELDQLSVRFSEALEVDSICSTWSDNAMNQTLTGDDVVVTITDNAGDNTLNVTTTQCSLNFGAISLGTDYLTGPTATFSGTGTHSSTLRWNVATHTLTLELGDLASGTLQSTPTAAATVTYTPANALVDLANNHITTSGFTATAQRF
ncbi:MAG TPA: hypothetical protein VGN51_10375 [Acidimicrobiia bacterium]|jgi:hypothetical protein